MAQWEAAGKPITSWVAKVGPTFHQRLRNEQENGLSKIVFLFEVFWVFLWANKLIVILISSSGTCQWGSKKNYLICRWSRDQSPRYWNRHFPSLWQACFKPCTTATALQGSSCPKIWPLTERVAWKSSIEFIQPSTLEWRKLHSPPISSMPLKRFILVHSHKAGHRRPSISHFNSLKNTFCSTVSTNYPT